LEHLIKELGIENMIQLAGNQPSAWKNLYHSNAYINTSIYEGFSGALVEAMMVGLPIIVSDIAMNLEAITHNETAIVFESNNITALESAITTLVEQYEHACEYGRAARIKAFEYFDIKVVIKKYEETINKILLNATK
jgi:glycosyltransferase involved in cell wall biosynthesis